MLTFDSVKSRLDREQSLSYMEFNYMILQAFDFYKLYERKVFITAWRFGPMGEYC